MALSAIHFRHGHGDRARAAVSADSVRTTLERGTYTALLSAVGFIIVNLLKIAERREKRLSEGRRP
ncbi:hypothetical protein [Mycetocola sp. 2940]|uniref:hypothetical protein n=1 Tax=Mycetocola sp. 2940 TaxID=3156452 RepID=UPI0033954E8A